MEIDKIIEQLSATSCDCHCGYSEEKATIECNQDCEYCEAIREAIKILEKIKTEPKIKLISAADAAYKVAPTTPWETYAWLRDMKYMEVAGVRFCEVEE